MADKYLTDYLDRYFVENHRATLVEMLEYADAFGKLIPTLEEVNEALSQRPSVRIERCDGRIIFITKGNERSISAEDFEKNYNAYHKEFWEIYRLSQTIRPVRLDDASSICEIYNQYVIETPITFEEAPVTLDEMQQRIVAAAATYPWFVCEQDGELLGYCYARQWKERTAYRHSVEVTVYLRTTSLRRGIGSALLAKLLAKLRFCEVHCVIGGVALPNQASVALLEKFSFRQIGHFREVGHKFGKWIDVGYWQLVF